MPKDLEQGLQAQPGVAMSEEDAEEGEQQKEQQKQQSMSAGVMRNPNRGKGAKRQGERHIR